MNHRALLFPVVVALIAGCSSKQNPPPANGSLSGAWALSADWGTDADFTATMTLVQSGSTITGAVPSWQEVSTGVIDNYDSTLNGSVAGVDVAFNRVDASGFRSTFVGTVAVDGNSMTGTVTNDPTSPGGNNAAGTWSATRQAGSSSGTAVTCADLQQCCPELGTGPATECRSIVMGGVATKCSVTLETYWAEDICRDVGPSYLVPLTDAGDAAVGIPDAGGAPTPDAGGAPTPDGGPTTANGTPCGSSSFTPAGPGMACTGGAECAISPTSASSCDAGVLGDACACAGVQFCCVYGTSAEYCYYSTSASVLATAMQNCGGTVVAQP